MNRVYNFSAGPACLPLSVLEQAGAEIADYKNSGMSAMELSHRSILFEEIIARTEELLRAAMNIPDNYKVLFLQGGASLQFSGIPMNLLQNDTDKADYIVTGRWSNMAYEEAQRYGDIKLAASSKDRNYCYIPEVNPSIIRPGAKYLHICYNNTVFGTRYKEVPETGGVPLVTDVSSCILSQPFDVTQHALLYASAQKNMGPSGLTVVIVRDDYIGKAKPYTPSYMDFKVQADLESIYNTPPCYSVYVAMRVLEWLRDEIGGVDAMYQINLEKAAILYGYLDESKLFKGTVDREYRSLMNIPFVTGNKALDEKFIAEAEAAGFTTIEGHRQVGGMRASIYNPMPVQGLVELVDFMKKFEMENR